MAVSAYFISNLVKYSRLLKRSHDSCKGYISRTNRSKCLAVSLTFTLERFQLDGTGIVGDPQRPLFRTIGRGTGLLPRSLSSREPMAKQALMQKASENASWPLPKRRGTHEPTYDPR